MHIINVKNTVRWKKRMINVGVSEGFHDAGVTVLDGQEIKYASHSER